jgi:hypothetical protein
MQSTWSKFRRSLKRLLVYLYCHGLMPHILVRWIFNLLAVGVL